MPTSTVHFASACCYRWACATDVSCSQVQAPSYQLAAGVPACAQTFCHLACKDSASLAQSSSVTYTDLSIILPAMAMPLSCRSGAPVRIRQLHLLQLQCLWLHRAESYFASGEGTASRVWAADLLLPPLLEISHCSDQSVCPDSGHLTRSSHALMVQDVESVTKKTYLKFPNSIEVRDCNGQRDFFTSFLTRESAFRSIITAWAHVRCVRCVGKCRRVLIRPCATNCPTRNRGVPWCLLAFYRLNTFCASAFLDTEPALCLCKAAYSGAASPHSSFDLFHLPRTCVYAGQSLPSPC